MNLNSLKNIQKKFDSIILGAGKPSYGEEPSSFKKINNSINLLNWQINTLKNFSKKIIFISGYKHQLFKKTKRDVQFLYNSEWRNQSPVGSLLKYNFKNKREILISYSDVIYRKNIIQKIYCNSADIVIGVDSLWQDRYEGRTFSDKIKSELFEINKRIKIKNFINNSLNKSYEFIGIVKFSQKVREFITQNYKKISNKWSLPELLMYLQKNGFYLSTEDCRGDWAELNAPQDLSKFILGTKSETLYRLKSMVKKSIIFDQVSFKVSEWQENKKLCLEKIRKKFENKTLIIRSSAINEDNFSFSNAGKYLSIPNINQNAEKKLINAVSRVVSSYDSRDKNNQILIQEMIRNSKISGVVTSRTLSYGAPYKVINYDKKTKLTDTVTSGKGTDIETFFILEKTKSKKFFNKLIKAVEEIEGIIFNDSLDIEFVIDDKDRVIILQVRPISVDHSKWLGMDLSLKTSVKTSKKKFEILSKKSIYPQNIYSNMQDWNPAEIVGRNPKKLSLSIYEYIITNKIWAIQRDEFGYNKLKSTKLIETFCGKPYVNSSKSFDSLIPKNIKNSIKKKLLRFYLNKLKKNPELHDKVEFEIAYTCFEFNFFERAKELKNNNFLDKEIEVIYENLKNITTNAINSIDKYFLPLTEIENILLKIENMRLSNLEKSQMILDKCKKFGSLPFAHLARNGFIAVSLINSAVKANILSKEDRENFLLGINTVAKEFKSELELLSNGKISNKYFLKKYGHLRPGTYEITSPSYNENFKSLFKFDNKQSVKKLKKKFEFPKNIKLKFESALGKHNLNVSYDDLIYYIRKSIEGREKSKFFFTKCVSKSLEYLKKFAKEIDVDIELFSHLSLNDLKKIGNFKNKKKQKERLIQVSKKNSKIYKLNCAIELPPIIKSSNDFYCFHYPNSIPNFITNKSIKNEIIFITHLKEKEKIDGKIVIIENADPGYDWIFSYKITGLITLYGGVNSHMAIRAAEFGLPAAIGVGESLFEQLKSFRMILLDCVNKNIEGIF